MVTRTLLVDDEPAIRTAMQRLVSAQGHEAVTASNGAEAIARLRAEKFDLCITDLRMPEADGFAVIEAARRARPAVPVVALAGQETVREAVAALRSGAEDFIAKPFHADVFAETVHRALRERWVSGEARRTHASAVVGEHPAMRLILERIDRVAETEANVLVRGEPGTGKEVVARLIHASSARRGGPFVAAFLGAHNGVEPITEGDLFGVNGTPGKFAAAQHGTLFLDEVAELAPPAQERLLRVLQERALPGPGGGLTPLDVRVIAGTHRNLEKLVREGAFARELFYRLDVIPIELAPLRDRCEDIMLLAEHFRREVNAREGKSVPGFSAEVQKRLEGHDWPGNLRQLRSAVERMVMVADDRQVTMADLPPSLRTDVVDLGSSVLDLPPYGVDLRLLLTQLEERLIGQALQRTGGNKNRAAELLGMNRTTLVEKLRRRNVA